MLLRKLTMKDAPLMLEWMHDQLVVEYMKTNFMEKKIEDCESFIASAQDTSHNLHLALTDENDIYMGTVSLKNIKNSSAEFGITVRSCAMGRGYAKQAMDEIIKIGFDQMGLDKIYWCVAPENRRAVRFYEKNGFHQTFTPEEVDGYTDEEKRKFLWYMIEK